MKIIKINSTAKFLDLWKKYGRPDKMEIVQFESHYCYALYWGNPIPIWEAYTVIYFSDAQRINTELKGMLAKE